MYIEIKQGRHEYDVICTILRSQDTLSPKCELSTHGDVKVGSVTYKTKGVSVCRMCLCLRLKNRRDNTITKFGCSFPYDVTEYFL